MTEQRYRDIDAGNGGVTDAEHASGWHCCAEWDGLLIGPGWGELAACTCYPVDHPVHLECRRMAVLIGAQQDEIAALEQIDLDNEACI